MKHQLACGHNVDVHVGTRLYGHYDVSFGIVTHIKPDVYGEPDQWFDFVMDGSPYKAKNSHGYYNAPRLTCVPCGVQDIKNRRNDPLVTNMETWEITRKETTTP